MNTINERIQVVVNEKFGGNVREFERVCNLKTDTLKHVVGGRYSKPSFDTMEQIANINTDISPEWLLTGKGEMIKQAKETAISFASSEFKQRGYSPFYSSLEVSAGDNYNFAMSQDEEPSSWIKIPGVNAERYFPIVGCSMEPIIRPGDVVGIETIDNWERLDPDKIYMIITNHDRMIKHLYTDVEDNEIIWAISENFPKFKFHISEIRGIFRVVWYGRLA